MRTEFPKIFFDMLLANKQRNNLSKLSHKIKPNEHTECLANTQTIYQHNYPHRRTTRNGLNNFYFLSIHRRLVY